MSPPLRRANAPVELDARALRAFIRTRNVNVPKLAEALQCDRSYLTKLQTGAAPRCSSAFFSRLCRKLGAEDPQSLMRYPDQYVPDAAVSTAEMPAQTGDGVLAAVPEQRVGRHRLDAAAAR